MPTTSYQTQSMYGYGQNTMFSSPYASNSYSYGNYGNSFCQPQSQSNNFMNMFSSILMMAMFAKFANKAVPQTATPAANTQTSQGTNLLQNLFGALLGNTNGTANSFAISNGGTYTNTGNLNNLYVFADPNEQININNHGNIGSINIINLDWLKNLVGNKTEEEPHKVAIITSYKNQYFGDYKYTVAGNEGESSDGVEVTLGRTIQDFAGVQSGNGSHWDCRAHDYNTDNDKELQELLSKMSDEDKNLKFEKGQAYIIDETTGKILGTVANNQVNQTDATASGGSYRQNTYADTSLNNSSFKVLKDLGVTQTYGVFNSSNKNNEEGQGGQIEINGIKYDVGTTVVRKETPLTFDLNGDGVKTSDKIVEYDINGDGKIDKVNDVADGTLCIRGGKDGKDLFGNNTDLDGDGLKDGFKDGFAALKSLALKEGLINGKDDMLLDAKDIKVLEEKYDFGMKTSGYNSEVKSLEELGITEINLGSTEETKRTDDFDGQGNDILKQEGASFKINGQEREYADVLNAIKG